MSRELFKSLCEKYSALVDKIINSNVKFYRTSRTIKWKFGYDDEVSILGACDKHTGEITVNIAAVDYFIRINEPLTIEYFLLHEIRHIYQQLEIADYQVDLSKCNNVELAKKWAEETNSYVTALDKDGNENAKYFLQDIEMDAFAYSYAIMRYKYGEVEYLYVPNEYKNDAFDKIVAEWQETFKNEGL